MRRGVAVLAAILVSGSRVSLAQSPGSAAADRARIAEITGDTTLISSSRSPARNGWQARPLLPELLFVWNSAIPFSANDGSLWAGRGMNASLTGGVRVVHSAPAYTVRLTIAPTFTYSQNLPFEIEPGREPGRSTYSSPWHLGRSSADLPLRFGNASLYRVDLGQSALALENGAVVVGISNSNEWWGPGLRNALVMSDNAAGIPRVFVGTARPKDIGIGTIEAEVLTGTLTKSLYFDSAAATDYRALSGFRATLRPRALPTLAIGLARTVYTPTSDAMAFLGESFRVLTYWRPMKAASDTLPDGSTAQQADQILSLFARWIFPEAGFEVYGEWARMSLPRSLGDLVSAAANSQGYTAGLQWVVATPVPANRVRIQAEFSNLEQSLFGEDRPAPDFYTGRAAPQGYTQRGQIIGAAIGPGSSSQWLAADWLAKTSQLGVFLGRIRWENDALYRQLNANFFSHDVSVLGGIRGTTRLPAADVSLQLTLTQRYNYLFHNGTANPGGIGTVDIRNATLGLRVTPQ
jgi:hypothetical protein